MKSLKANNNSLADTLIQLDVISNVDFDGQHFETFESKLKSSGLYPLTPAKIDIFQVNVGKMCNQVCKHCHVDAGPDRKEIMSYETMECILDILAEHRFAVLDITGGAPEMNPNFRWFVESASALVDKIIVRCNLTIIVANKKYNDLPQFFRKHKIEVVSSLPFYNKERTDIQRGDGVFEDSIKALRMLNEAGYGMEGSELLLNLVYNPAGAFLPPSQKVLEDDFKKELSTKYGISFNNLFSITNLPISRFLDYLLSSGNFERYMEKLIMAYNPVAAQNVMCRNTLSIGWDGYIYDCDFNQMLDLKVNGHSKHISDFDFGELTSRTVIVNQHCFGCTAGAGSSCGGEIVS